MNLLSDILQVTFGVSSLGAVAVLGFKLLQIVTRHNLLLVGQCLDEVTSLDQGDEQGAKYPRHFRYRLRIQSLEATHSEYAMQVKVKGIPSGSTVTLPRDHVWAIAGWKTIEIVQNDLGDGRSQRPKAGEPNESDEPYVWRANFPELPAFDAWSFDVVMPCERLEFSVAFVGSGERKFFAPTFGPYFAPDHLTVFASDREEPRVNGSVTMPRPVVPVILSILAIVLYALSSGLSGLRIEWGSFTSLDGYLMLAELIFIWIGYAFIKRPVYPVISGYRFITPPWPDEHRLN
jgi:hypothetical protein